ncbi:MAG: V-type ATP synthase subunit E family protein [Anaerolineales bacterium]|jgi:V/A-type H+-transporting ATPase subunit E
MKSPDENIKVLSRAVLSDAREDAEQALNEAKAKAEEIRQNAREEAEANRSRIMEQAHREAERVRSQAVAVAQLKARTMELEQREKLLEDVFSEAHQKLTAMQRDSDYEQVAERLLRESLKQLNADMARVRADKTTQEIFTTSLLEKVSKDLDVKIQMGETLEQGTGVVVETMDGHRQLDNTLETRLTRMEEALRTPVYRILTGESA